MCTLWYLDEKSTDVRRRVVCESKEQPSVVSHHILIFNTLEFLFSLQNGKKHEWKRTNKYIDKHWRRQLFLDGYSSISKTLMHVVMFQAVFFYVIKLWEQIKTVKDCLCSTNSIFTVRNKWASNLWFDFLHTALIVETPEEKRKLSYGDKVLMTG